MPPGLESNRRIGINWEAVNRTKDFRIRRREMDPFRAVPLLWILLLVFSSVGLIGQDDARVLEPVRYEHRLLRGPVSVHILYVVPNQVSIRAVKAGKGTLGRETVSEIAKRWHALAAVNGGFFRIGGPFDGEPVGVLKTDSHWLSDSPIPRGVIGWDRSGGNLRIERLQTEWGIRTRIGEIPVGGINRPPSPELVVLYTSKFGKPVPGGGGFRVRVENDRILDTRSDGDLEAGPAQFVLWVGSEVSFPAADLRPGDPVEIIRTFRSAEGKLLANAVWEEMDYIVGGTPVLIRTGKPVGDYSSERIQPGFVSKRHPRTAVGVLPDGRWVFLVADGRRPDHSIGLTLEELTDLMLEIGCVDALNLDGGGSSTFFFNGQVRNLPSDPTGERPVSDAILVLEP